ncbi:hypothetical protein N7462_010518 [Penicillium macrosclerotiorum]|uniref:uncharacterized protein n=1 Tax=Penicillium macrosclerotiorum TaxID=303699 RepID=UPI0025469DC4|nr:uncharacterized protein N7462_010518 [Penicillium macrosclerotiorum]KAJ5669448.1 hypothetical protein N7462_010518 [Penicillium macrosclerotiorum]
MPIGLEIPDAGLSLRPGDQSGDSAAKPTQIMRLNLVQSTLDELIHSLRSDSPARIRLGKHPSLHFAGKSQPFHAYPETHRSEIYHTSPGKRNLYFTGVLSHSLEVEKAKEATAATDQALANLEESLNAFERGKESKKTHIIQHPDELKALRAANAGSTARRAPKTKAELDKDRLLRTAANRSLTSSPTLGGPNSPAPALTLTSAPSSQTKDTARREALKTPFIHLLAVRAVSTKFLARQTCSSIEDCTALAQKYGVENRIDREKFDLKDKIYKDLDVWNFPFPNQEDRQAAIDRAISAFDRMRISKSDKQWQTLLPKEERGKGKCLSKLNLQNGLSKKPVTPQIQVDGADDRKEGDTTGNETDRGTGLGVTSKARDAAPRSTATTSKPRTEKDAPKRGPKSKPATNTTLAGRVTKKTASKAPPKTESKFKSAEFVYDSDESDEIMLDAAPLPAPAPAQRPKEEAAAVPKKTPATVKARTKETAPSAPTSKAPKVPKTEAPTPKLESSKTASKRPPSRPSISPRKPSPLGSSPPTNASEATGRSRSDSQNQSSSSSSSPLISQIARVNKTTGTAARPSKPAVPAKSLGKPATAANPLKRKAEPERLAAPSTDARTTVNLEHKRRRAVSTSSGGSTGSASPPMGQELARQRLYEKSQWFKRLYAKYHTLHDDLAAQTTPSQVQLDKLRGMHDKLQAMKQEIWDEHRGLRNVRS